MDPFTLQRRLYREFVKTRPALDRGMPQLIAAARQTSGGKQWTRGEDIHWDAGLVKWVAWFDELLASHPIPRDTELLWFEAPSESNEAMTSASAYAKLRTKAESYGLEAPRTWPIDERGMTLPAGLHMLAELEDFRTANGLNDDNEGEDADVDDRGLYAIDFCYALLLVLNGLPRTGLLRSLKAGSVAVMLGWAGGGEEVVGQLGAEGWGPIRRVRSAPRPAREDPRLSPGHPRFSITRYIASGLDINAANESGETLLMQLQHDDAATVRAALRAGASATARDREGNTVLHHFGACEPVVLAALLDAGADPALRNQRGASGLDHMISDGLCSEHHVLMLVNRGHVDNIAHLIASRLEEWSVAQRAGLAPEAIDRLVSKGERLGQDLNHAGAGGLAPLWRALVGLSERIAWVRDRLGDTGPFHTDRLYVPFCVSLIKHGADPNSRLDSGLPPLIARSATPLMVRAYHTTELVEVLLRNGADPHARCAAGRTALDYAREAAQTPGALAHERAAEVADLLEVAMRKRTSGPHPGTRRQ